MKHLSLLLLLSVFLASCGQEIVPPSPAPAAPVKTEVVVPVIKVQNRAMVEKDVTTTSSGIIESNSWDNHKTMDIVVDGVIFQIPWGFGVSYDIKDTLVSIWGIKRDGMNLFGLTVYEEKTIFTSYEDYLQDLKNNFIKKLIKENNKDFSESDINNELKKLEGHFFIESKEINGIKVVIHKRDFYGMIGKIYDMYVFIWNGKVLHFSSETDYQEILDQIYSSIKFQNSINKPISFSDTKIQDILAKIESYMNSLNARANTGSLVVGNYSAVYRNTDSGDFIDVNINNNKTTFTWIKTKKDNEWEKQCKIVEKIWDCDWKNNFCWADLQNNNQCKTAKVDWKNCFICYEGSVMLSNFSNHKFNSMLDFSPSGKYLLVGTTGGSWPLQEYITFLFDTKTGEQALKFPSLFHSYQWWTPDKKQFIFVKHGLSWDESLNITKVNEFPKTNSILIKKGEYWDWDEKTSGWNDDQYVYLLSEKDSVKKLRIFSITELKEVFSKEIQ